MDKKASPPITNAEANDDPDAYLIQSSVAEVRGLEKRIRANIETQRHELRTMVGEQYLDLISAADAIITMSKDAQIVQTKLERMQLACDVSNIQEQATVTAREKSNSGGRNKEKQRSLYVLAALIKSLADVPEQIWHELESHQYLQAGRLYTLAQVVHEYLEQDVDESFINIDLAFPVVQRQWDAVSSFRPQIIQRSMLHLRVSEQSSESVSETLTNLMLLDGLTYEEAMNSLLETRLTAIHDILQSSVKIEETTQQDQRIAHHLREVVQIIQRTVIHVFEIFYQGKLLEKNTEKLGNNFMMGSTGMPAIARVFSPSTNVHLLIRYLPQTIQNYTPHINNDAPLHVDKVQTVTKAWLKNVEELLEDKLPSVLEQLASQKRLVDIRTRLWDLLNSDDTSTSRRRISVLLNTDYSSWQQACQALLGELYSIWGTLFRDAFGNQAKRLIDTMCASLASQPNDTIWPRILDLKEKRTESGSLLSGGLWQKSSQHPLFGLPNSSSVSEISQFQRKLGEISHGQTQWVCEFQTSFDSALKAVRHELDAHLSVPERRQFHSKQDTQMVRDYTQQQCFEAVSKYIASQKSLLANLNGWTDRHLANDVAILIAQLALSLGSHSKELENMFTLPEPATNHQSFELRSGMTTDPKYKELCQGFMDIYHNAHEPWIEMLADNFTQKLTGVLTHTTWNDQCPAILVWEAVGGDEPLPCQASNKISLLLFEICQEVQRVNSRVLDKTIMQSLRQKLASAMIQSVTKFCNSEHEMTEKGAMQLAFDIHFMIQIFQNGLMTNEARACLNLVTEKIDPINWAAFESHYQSSVQRFYLKQMLILGILTCPGRETFDRSRKASATQQQQQHNVLPLAPQTPRFTLLPIGHLETSIRAR